MIREAGLRIGTSAFFVMLFGYGVYEMAPVQRLAGGFPLVISSLGLAASLLTLVVEATTMWKLRAQRVAATAGAAGQPARVEQRTSEGVLVSEELQHLGRVAYYFLWTIGFAFVVWLLGALLGTYLFLLAFFAIDAKTHWRFLVVGPIAAVFFLWVLEVALDPIQWPEGLLQIL